MNLYRDGVFVHEVDDQTCVAAAVQATLNLIRLNEDGHEPDVSTTSQRRLYDRIVALTTDEDSHVGGTGPGGWAALLTEEGYPTRSGRTLANDRHARRRQGHPGAPAARSGSWPGPASTRG